MKTPTQLPYLLCEIANVHGGDKTNVENLISQFGELDYSRKGIKFQIFKPERIALKDYEWFTVYKELYFDEASWASFIKLARKYGDVWIDVFDTYSTDVIKNNINDICGIKLQASVLNNLEVLERLRKMDLVDKRLIINVSGYELSSIHSMIETFLKICPNLILQIGYQSYPTTIENTGLQKIPIMKSAFPELAICMADHADANTDAALQIPVYASLLGCCYIEKHFCVSRKDAKYDGFSALEADQMDKVCISLMDAYKASHGKFVSIAEEQYLNKSIQVPVLKRKVVAGSLLSPSDFIYRRTAQQGINDSEISQLQMKRMILSNNKKEYSAVHQEDYRPARIAVIVAGRMKSSRLVNKAILPIGGVSSVERCLEQCLGIRGVEQVILATSDLETDNILEKYLLGGRAKFWKGHPDDVIGRYLGACENFGVDVVVRVTADCPIVLPEIVEYMLEKHFESGADYTAAEECAVGTSGEIINTDALKKIANHFGNAKYSEYMTWYFRNNPEHFKLNIVSLPEAYVRNYRLTLDYAEDLEMFEELFSKLTCTSGVQHAQEIFSVLDANPDIVKINSHLTLKYKTDSQLISLLDKETKMDMDMDMEKQDDI